MGLFSSIKKFKGQDYDKLKKKCQGAGVLFTDSEFPAAARSISPKGVPPANVVWKRPHEICEKPRLFVDGVGTGDVTQGQLGNCWFVAACSVLAGVKVLWNKVIPDYEEQEYSDEDPKRYAGIFHFRFWRFGEWVDVVIDDQLPTVHGQLIYTHSRERSEFWSALLEKAYAKINTSYESLDGGNLCDALVDFTSGVSATIDLLEGGYRSDDTKKTQLFKQLRREMDDYALMCAAVAARSKAEVEQRTELGLVKGHAYGITAIKKVPIGNTTLVNFFTGREKIYMVRLRNPWGEKEWNGPFSDGNQLRPPDGPVGPPKLSPNFVRQWHSRAAAAGRPETPPVPTPARQVYRELMSPPAPAWLAEKEEKRVFALPRESAEAELSPENPFYEEAAPAASAPPPEKSNLGSPSISELFNGLEEGDKTPLPPADGRRTAEPARSPEWSKISESEREKIGLTFDNDGEFWMTFDDFVSNFTDVSVCQLINTSFFSFSKTWKEEREFGHWTPGVPGRSLDRAGGCLNNRSTFLNNPQYRFDVDEEVEEVIVQLSQKDQREKKHEGALNLCIGFHIMKVEVNRQYRVHRIQESAATSDYIRSRSIFWRDQLSRGRYVLVPTTFSPGEKGDFMLRLFMGSDPQLRELVKEQPKPSCWPCITPANGVVVVKVVSATGLEKQDSLGSADPYVIIRCGKTKVRSPPVKESLNPTWNCKAIFYRTGLTPIKIQVWNSCLLKDKFMGQATLRADNSPGNVTEFELNLFGKTRAEANERRPGKLAVEVVADADMAAV
ncbi:Calpain-5 [Amphibalanus amphitrite]|uniref:Calpain-5 n=1 Tax=Amphibalanus amphitrite TaxID=1232801 RepID=A0A6A4VJJ4_AMPAM|nr:Calpain-5 [Amphibalanus amphitrite]